MSFAFAFTDLKPSIGEAAHECVSEEALVHLKSYKYSSVDRSLLSYYILNPYVRSTSEADEADSG